MSDLDAVLERLITDPAFAHELSRNPTEALAGYELTGDDLATLSTQVSFDRGAGGHVEERISKSSTFGLLSSMAGGLSGLGGDATGLGGPDTTPAMVGVEDPTTIGDPNLAPGVIDPNQAPGGEHGYGFAVDAFNPSEARRGRRSAAAPTPHQRASSSWTSPTPGSATRTRHRVSATRTKRPGGLGIHEVDGGNPTESVGFHEVDQPAPDGGAGPRRLVGFNPQPDPPGLRG